MTHASKNVGFTRADVVEIQRAAGMLDGHAGSIVDTQGPNGIAGARDLSRRADHLRSIAARIAALLPPESP